MTSQEREAVDDLVPVLAETRRLATARERSRLDALAERMVEQRLRVLVAGEAKRGKSTLINALLGRRLLPTGVTPLTAVTTTVTALHPPEQEHAEVTFLDGRREAVALERLGEFVTESGNAENLARVREVVVKVDSPLLATHALDLVDTPGIGSVYEHNTAEAQAALSSLDAAVLVLTVDPPITQAERELLTAISALSLQTFVLLNKSDRMDPHELQEALAFTEQVCADATRTPLRPMPCSARQAPEERGFAAFRDLLTDYLRQHGRQDTTRSLHRHVVSLLATMLDDVRMRIRTRELVGQGRSDSITQLRQRLHVIEERRPDIGDRCTGSLRRLRRELDVSAATETPALTRGCRQALEEKWQRELKDLSPDDLEPRARAALEETITPAVESWRDGATGHLERGLARVVEQAETDVATQLELARQAVEETLELRLTDAPPTVPLPVDTAFRYDFAIPVGWAPPLQKTVSRLGTTSRRRARTRTAVMGDVALMVDRQLGRSRADLQQRLEASGRALRRALDERFAEGIGRLRDAISVVQEGTGTGAALRADDLDALRQRGQLLGELLTRAQEGGEEDDVTTSPPPTPQRPQ